MMGIVFPNGNIPPIPALCSQALSPWNETEQFASQWLYLYCKNYGDSDPTSFNIAVFEMEKGLLYDKYAEFCMKASNESNLNKRSYVSRQIFSNIWLSLYPFVNLKRDCHQVGKCTTCYIIQDAREKTTDARKQEALCQCHACHRSMFMGERNYYQSIIFHACTFFKSVLCFIIDKMDNRNCAMPFLGSQTSFPKPLDQGMTGCLVHGPQGGITIYRTQNNVKKGANLTIHIILNELDKWVKRNGCYPEEVFFQADGGSENANKTVLAFLEFIVAKRLTQRAVFTRLPKGHTHNDIDGGFGVLSEAMATEVIPTLDQFDELIATPRLSMFNVEDVMIVSDYESFFEPHIDPHIKRLHKEMQTQLQWRFTAQDPLLNGGRFVDVKYRAFARDQVIEIFQRPVEECKTTLGKASGGFEPMTTYVSDFPQTYTLNFLLSIPILPSSALFIDPQKFDEECLTTFAETQRECNSFFLRGSPAWTTWRKYFSDVVPKSLDPLEYLNQIRDKNLKFRYFTPFLRIFKGGCLPLKPLSETSRHFGGVPDWPVTVQAYATPSVMSINNRNPPPPREFISADVHEQRRFDMAIDDTSTFFANLNRSTQAELEFILSELLAPDGTSVSKSGTKTAQISQFTDFFKSVLSSFVNSMYPSDELYVMNKLTQPHSSLSLAGSFVASITVSSKIIRLSKISFQSLLPGMKLTTALINFIYLLYKNYNQESLERRKDNFGVKDPIPIPPPILPILPIPPIPPIPQILPIPQIAQIPQIPQIPPIPPIPNPNPNRKKNEYTHKKSLNFLSYVFLRALLEETTGELIDKDSINDSQFIYIHVKEDNDSLLLIVDMSKGEILYYDPMLTTADAPNLMLINRIQIKYNILLCKLLQSYSSQVDFWKPTKVWIRVKTPYITPPSNEFVNDKDMYILSFVYFQLHYLNAPLVFNQSSVEYFRKKVALWILTGRMPSQFY